MPDLGTYESNLKNIESQLGQYGSNLPSEIESQIQGAYTPLLKESLDVTRDQMSDYLGRYFDVTSMGTGMQGTSAIDLSPTQKLGVMGRELGTMSGNLQASQRYSDYLGGQMNDMYQKALGAAQMGQQNLADQYARELQMYQMKWQEAENAKNRAASSGGGGGYAFDPSKYINQSQTKAPSQEDLLKGIQSVANTIASQRGKAGGTYSYNGMNLGSIDDAFNYIMNNAKTNYNLNLNPQWLWSQLGNKANQSYRALL